jgi:hypothetical protein
LSIALSVAALGFVASSAEAKSNESRAVIAPVGSNSVVLQQRRGQGRWGDNDWRGNHRVRVATQSRLVQVGRRVFRETYQIRYLPNGRTQTTLISRVRVR